VFELSKILCPVDFSERSQEAVRYGAALARHFRSELLLVHVVEPRAAWSGPEMGAPMIEELLDIERENARKRLEALAPEGPKQIRRVVLDGDAALEIVKYAKIEASDLTVMPTHGYGPFRQFILGSVTAKVLHDAECPILTGVHVDTPAPPQDFRMLQILCAVGLGPDSERVFLWANRFARSFRSRLIALHVARGAASDSNDGAIQEARSQMERLRNVTEANVEVMVEAGEDIAKTVCSAAEGLGANLTIIGRGGLGETSGRLRANAYAIIRQSRRPVISV